MNIFQSIGGSKPQYTKFDLSHEHKTTCKIGTLNPILCREVLPGDKFNVQHEIFMRLMPMISPVMHRMNVYTHSFFVPNRLVWNEWEDFITGGEDGLAAPVFPQIALTENVVAKMGKGSLSHRLGIPVPVTDDTNCTISALAHRAYALIWNEWYRDQNLQDKINVIKDSGIQSESDSLDILDLQKRNWEKDCFTSALPFAQKGDAVLLPLNGTITSDVTYKPGTAVQKVVLANGSDADNGTIEAMIEGGQTKLVNKSTDFPGTTERVNLDPNGTLEVQSDLSAVTGSTNINDLREAFQVQKYLERLARGGSRYTEYNKSMFGVKSKDERLQRPEYIGGGAAPVMISEVLQTSQTQTTPQGTMTGHGTAVGQSNGFNYYCPEHGFIITLLSVMPRSAYQNGLPKQYKKFDKLDYGNPLFAHLGEEPVKNQELFWQQNPNDSEQPLEDNGTFGYQSKFYDYRYFPSVASGEFTDTLAFWGMQRIFTSLPGLNNDFIECNNADGMKRIFAVTDPTKDELIVQCFNSVIASRPLPFDASPGMIDHF